MTKFQKHLIRREGDHRFNEASLSKWLIRQPHGEEARSKHPDRRESGTYPLSKTIPVIIIQQKGEKKHVSIRTSEDSRIPS